MAASETNISVLESCDILLEELDKFYGGDVMDVEQVGSIPFPTTEPTVIDEDNPLYYPTEPLVMTLRFFIRFEHDLTKSQTVFLENCMYGIMDDNNMFYRKLISYKRIIQISDLAPLEDRLRIFLDLIPSTFHDSNLDGRLDYLIGVTRVAVERTKYVHDWLKYIVEEGCAIGNESVLSPSDWQDFMSPYDCVPQELRDSYFASFQSNKLHIILQCIYPVLMDMMQTENLPYFNMGGHLRFLDSLGEVFQDKTLTTDQKESYVTEAILVIKEFRKEVSGLFPEVMWSRVVGVCDHALDLLCEEHEL